MNALSAFMMYFCSCLPFQNANSFLEPRRFDCDPARIMEGVRRDSYALQCRQKMHGEAAGSLQLFHGCMRGCTAENAGVDFAADAWDEPHEPPAGVEAGMRFWVSPQSVN